MELSANTQNVNPARANPIAPRSETDFILTTVPARGRPVSLQGDLRSGPVLPMTAGEVGEFLRRAAVGHRGHAERPGSRPCGGVVDVQVGAQAFAHALEQAIEHDVIHAAVAAEFLSDLALLGPQRVLVLLPLVE